MDGGDIEFVKLEDDYVYVKLFGSCAQCIAQDETLNEGVFIFIAEEFPTNQRSY